MTDTERDDALDTAVARFLDGAASVYGEYEQGYMDADAALTELERHVEDLRRAAERDGETGADGEKHG